MPNEPVTEDEIVDDDDGGDDSSVSVVAVISNAVVTNGEFEGGVSKGRVKLDGKRLVRCALAEEDNEVVGSNSTGVDGDRVMVTATPENLAQAEVGPIEEAQVDRGKRRRVANRWYLKGFIHHNDDEGSDTEAT